MTYKIQISNRAQADIDKAAELGIPIECCTMVLSVSRDHLVTCVSPVYGIQRIQAKAVSADNEKYAMRIWLLRLGMNGPEYKDERRILMKNLSGHCAFRTEEDKERWQQKQNEKRDALKAMKQAMEVSDDADAE